MKIALVGKARSGKDTVGERLVNIHSFKRFYFAQGIEEIIVNYFPEAFKQGKPRKHYQHIGQELRGLDKDVWINFTLGRIGEHLTRDKASRVLITDCRQLNEAQRLREEGYMLVKVVCKDQTRVDRILKAGEEFKPETFYHDTELQTDLIVPDLVIENEGTLGELYAATEDIIKFYNEVFIPKINRRTQHEGK